MKKWIKRGGLTLLCAIFLYYSTSLISAYRQTPEIRDRFLAPEKIDLQIDAFSDRQLEILIRVQDPNFWNHKGVEFTTPGSGWTTITQSIAKWFYFHPFKPGIRKIEQTLLARFVLHGLLSKEEQLLVFVNHVWFAPGVLGFQDAALHFYKKPLKELSEDQFIVLLAMPVNPRSYNPLTHPARNRERVEKIKSMLSGDYQLKGLFDIYYDKTQ